MIEGKRLIRTRSGPGGAGVPERASQQQVAQMPRVQGRLGLLQGTRPSRLQAGLGKGKEAGNAWRLEVAGVRRLPGDLRKGPRPRAPLCVTLSHCCPMGPGLFSPALLRAEIQQGLPG